MCDMTVWYLFACANGGEYTQTWNCPEGLPRVRGSWLLCDAQDDGFDSGRGMKKKHITFLQQGTHNVTKTPIMLAYYQSKINEHNVMFRLSSLHTHDKTHIPELFSFCSEKNRTSPHKPR
jgi:hypothetical protein